MAAIVEKFTPALHPVLRIDSNHESCLVVECRVLAVDPSFRTKISADRQMQEMPVISNLTIKCLPPEIRLSARPNHKSFPSDRCRSRLVEPFHMTEQLTAR
jgi:hypothetical protein